MKIPCPACGFKELTPPKGSRASSHWCGSCARTFDAEALVLAERRKRKPRSSRITVGLAPKSAAMLVTYMHAVVASCEDPGFARVCKSVVRQIEEQLRAKDR